MEGMNAAFASLATADVTQLRMSAVILRLLIDQGILTSEQAIGALNLGTQALPKDHPLQPVIGGIRDEFR